MIKFSFQTFEVMMENLKLRWMLVLLIFTVEPQLQGKELNFLDHGIASVYAIRSDTKEVLIEENSQLSLTPASSMKIVTTAAALHLLGAEYRFETHLEYDGFIDDAKTLQGNLYIRGGGDPCLGSERISHTPSAEQQIEIWADAIEQLGIQRIAGSVIGDATKWEKALAVPSWNWEDLGNYYGAGASALSFRENAYSLLFKPGEKEGESAHILRTEPPLPMMTFFNEVKMGPEGSGDRACIYGTEFSSVRFVRGTIPCGVEEFAIKGAIPDPAAYCARILAKCLEKRGIATEMRDLAQQDKRYVFHTTYSPPVEEIVYWTNQKSINLYAEHLLKKMGEVVYGEGSTAAGIKAVTNFWKAQHIDLEGFNMSDGSGLSRMNMITAKQLVQILAKMKEFPSFPVFLASLPQRGEMIRAKTGSMSFIRCYAGYADNVTFAILINQCADYEKMKAYIEKILIEWEKA